MDELRGDISRLELSLGAAKAEYDKIKAANLSETARFAAERRAEYIQMLENFTATQVGRGGGWGRALCMHAGRTPALRPQAKLAPSRLC